MTKGIAIMRTRKTAQANNEKSKPPPRRHDQKSKFHTKAIKVDTLFAPHHRFSFCLTLSKICLNLECNLVRSILPIPVKHLSVAC